jgi:hypothetical protein
LEEEHIEKISSKFIVSQNSVPEFNWRMLVEKLAASPWNGGKKLDPGGWDSVAPVGLPIMNQKKPIALDENGIHKVIADFKAATIRAVKAGIRLWKFMRLTVFIAFISLSILERMRMEEV